MNAIGTIVKAEPDRMFILNMHISAFLRSMDAVGCAEGTLQAYRLDLMGFSKWLRKRNTSFSFPNRSDVEEYISSLAERGLKPRTILRYVSSLKIFCNYVVEIDSSTTNPMDGIPMIKVDRSQSHPLTEKEVMGILGAPDMYNRIGYRNRVMLELLFGTGIRVSELINIKLRHLRLDERELLIVKKSKPVELLLLGKVMCVLLRAFIKEQRLKILLKHETDYLFPTTRGTLMTRQAFWRIFRKYTKMVGIDKGVSSSMARHTLAKNILDGGGSLEDVRKRLRHVYIMTTKKYCVTLGKNM